VYLSQHELTAASSVVAALAILGGYLGVRSANRNALKIAREERLSRMHNELDTLKRVTYAKFLAALSALASASQEHEAITASPEIRGDTRIAAIKKRTDALTTAQNMLAELELIAPDVLRELAADSLECARECTRKNSTSFIREAAKLRLAMRYDLQDIEANPRDMDPLAVGPIGTQPSNIQDEHPTAPLSTGSATDSSGIAASSAPQEPRRQR
jgi:hypothetical protein